MSMTVKTYTMEHFGLTEAEYEDLVTAMRIVDDHDAVDYAFSGKVTPSMQERMTPMPTPKQVYKQAKGAWKLWIKESAR